MTTAPDRADWMAQCADRRERPAVATEVVVTITGLSGQIIDRARVDVATGRSQQATVLAFRTA